MKRLQRIAENSSKNEKNTLPALLLLLSCYDAERNCKDFKTGKFKFDYRSRCQENYSFERNDSIEIETLKERQILHP
jgi:hypothetical protein